MGAYIKWRETKYYQTKEMKQGIRKCQPGKRIKERVGEKYESTLAVWEIRIIYIKTHACVMNKNKKSNK